MKYMNTSVIRGEHGAVIPSDDEDDYCEIDSEGEGNEMVTVEVRRVPTVATGELGAAGTVEDGSIGGNTKARQRKRGRTRKNGLVGAQYSIAPNDLECLFAPEAAAEEGVVVEVQNETKETKETKETNGHIYS